MAVSPEEAGLCGCWQFIAMWRERHTLRRGQVVKIEEDYSFYVGSLAQSQRSAGELAELIRGHWGACENGSHYRRDVTLGEDASAIAGRRGAQVMATLRNLVLGLFELQKHRGQTQAAYVPSWRRGMSASTAIHLVKAT